MKNFLLLLLCLVPSACSYPKQNQSSPQTSSAESVLRSPVEASSLPSMSMDLARSIPSQEAGRLQETFVKGINALKSMLATRADVDPEKLVVAVQLYDARLGQWSANSGLTPKSPEHWWTASVTKLITSAVILQMIEQGHLSLTNTLNDFLPQIPQAHLITLDDLLCHTSGLFSFNGDPDFRAAPRYYSPEELIAIATRHGPDFPPGTAWGYSNTGYVVLARVAEIIDGKSFADIVQTRFAKPLGLKHFTILEPKASPPLVSAATTRPPAPAELASLSGAGGLAAGPGDLLVFLHAYLTGKLVSRSTLTTALERLHPMNDAPIYFGRGVMVFDVPDTKRPALWLGHSGGSPDGKALAVYDVNRGAFMVIMMNVQAPAEALGNSLLKALDGVP